MVMPEIVVVTGMSGAGKSIVLRTLEDAGFFCIDNLPSQLVGLFLGPTLPTEFAHRRIALGVDIRAGGLEAIIPQLIKARAEEHIRLTIIFLAASDATLMTRFQETRRQHPLGTGDLAQDLLRERELLEPLRQLADRVIATDQLTMHELRLLIRSGFGPDGVRPLVVTLTSFGYKYGVPAEQNFVFDLRSLPNPYFIPELKVLDGTHPAVQDYLFAQPTVLEYWKRFIDFFTFGLTCAQQEGRSLVAVALGCTGGRHRSVAFVERVALLKVAQVEFSSKHRDRGRDNYGTPGSGPGNGKRA